LNFQATPERIERLEGERAFVGLAQSKKKGAAGAKEQAEGRALQESIRAKSILSALSERDETAEICRDKDGHAEPDPELRDTESVPLSESVETFFERESSRTSPTPGSTPAAATKRTARWDRGLRDQFQSIEADVRAIETDIVRMLAEVTGSATPEGAAGG
jgi:type I restriction enzyme M protein